MLFPFFLYYSTILYKKTFNYIFHIKRTTNILIYKFEGLVEINDMFNDLSKLIKEQDLEVNVIVQNAGAYEYKTYTHICLYICVCLLIFVNFKRNILREEFFGNYF